MWMTRLCIKPWTAQDVITPCSSHTCLTDPNLLYCGKPFGSGAQFSILSVPSMAINVRNTIVKVRIWNKQDRVSFRHLRSVA